MRSRLIEETCTKAKLDTRYSGTLEKIIKRIEAGGCEVMAREDGVPSSYTPYTDRPPIIRINLNRVEEPLNVFWRLLHEYEHHLSGTRQEMDQTMAREEVAWEKADAIVQEYPYLLPLIADYSRCKAHDLNTYRVYFATENFSNC